MQFFVEVHFPDDDRVTSVNIFEENLEDFDTEGVSFVEPDSRGISYTASDIATFVEIIDDTGMSQELFDELMETAEIHEIVENGLGVWFDAEDFVDEEFLDLMDIGSNLTDPVVKGLLYRNINYESLAEDIVSEADGGQQYFSDGRMFVKRSY